ncbi:MAG: DNA recombination protein RmuC [Clostridiales bacterium]|nr:DNA recombination protein RmuC [Clostridiales bacterium]
MELYQFIIILCLLLLIIIEALFALFRKPAPSDHSPMLEKIEDAKKELAEEIRNEVRATRMEVASNVQTSIQSSIKGLGDTLTQSQQQTREVQDKRLSELTEMQDKRLSELKEMQDKRLSELNEQLSKRQEALQTTVSDMMKRQEERMNNFSMQSEQRLENIRVTVESRLTSIREENNKQLDKMRETVDEKLQKTLESRIGQSFKEVSDRLEQVYKGLGEMQALATGVGDLKKVLSNVKTRGILGEIQLAAILEQILSQEQYEKNVITKPGSKDMVEFAIKLPGDGQNTVYLPIDAKYPGEAYSELINAYETGNQDLVDIAAKKLIASIKNAAKDISTKYICPPQTTDFGIMFLPVEGLYAEVIRRGLVEELQRDYKINIAGPTTMAALLNSLQMGFQTLAIQKRSSEVWDILRAVKTEFQNFGDILNKTQKQLESAQNNLGDLVGKRTRAIQSKLRNITLLPDGETQQLLSIEDAEEDDGTLKTERKSENGN